MLSNKRHKGTKAQRHKGLLIILSSASGGGKTTIAKRIVQKDPNFILSVSHTTRAKRGKEQEGEDYFFVSEKQFEKMIGEEKFLEWAKVHGEFYGTSRDFVQKNLSCGKDVILVIDVKGAKQVKDKYHGCISIFIVAPSLEELKKRLRKRGTESEEEIAKRVEIASWEGKQAKDYDYKVVNDKLDDAVDRVLSIINTEREKRR